MMALMRLKIAVFAPMPSAKEITTMVVKPGLFCINRNAYRTSCKIMVGIIDLFGLVDVVLKEVRYHLLKETVSKL